MTRSLADVPEKLKPFVFHGVELPTVKGDYHSGDCPFCGKDGHFNVKLETGQWRCVRCDQQGNHYSFLQMLLSESLAGTTDKDYEELSADRNIPVWGLKDFKLARSVITGEWLIPTFNAKGAINNLYRCAVAIDDKLMVMSTPNCKQSMFGLHLITESQSKRRVMEGPWDGIAMYCTLASTKKSGEKLVQCKPGTAGAMIHKTGVLATPGAGSFQEHWLESLDGMPCELMFDSDHPVLDEEGNPRMVKGKPIIPGWDGQQRAIKLMSTSQNRPSRVLQVMWGEASASVFTKDAKAANQDTWHGFDPDKPSGYDYRDCLREKGQIMSLIYVESLLHRVDLEESEETNSNVVHIDPIERTSLAQLVNDFKGDGLHVTDSLYGTIAVSLAVVVSTTLQGDQLFLRMIGPPGSGKTTLIEAISAAREYVLPRSIVTGFHSGFTGNEGGRGRKKKDASLIPVMQHKTVAMKDADTLNSCPNRNQIMSEFRDLYDGASRAQYRNEVQNEYEDIRTTFILCGTDDLRSSTRNTALGERFLDVEILDAGEDTRKFLQASFTNTFRKVTGSLGPKNEPAIDNDHIAPDKEHHLKACTYGFIKYLKDNLEHMDPPEPLSNTEAVVTSMGEFVSYMRARHAESADDAECKSRAELGTRLVAQFTKLSICLAIVLGRPTIDEDVLKLVRKVGRDTIYGYRYDLTMLLIKNPGGLSIKQLCSLLNIPETKIRRLLNDMQEFNIVTRMSKANRSGQRGRDLHVWQLTESMLELYNTAFTTPVVSKATYTPSTNGARRTPTRRKVH